MTPLQKIREACIKANPEIMELKFGCEVELSLKNWQWQTIVRRDGMDEGWLGDNIYFGTNEIKKIVGRPIRLADVLLAIGNKGDKDTPNPIWAIDLAGEFFDQSSSDGSPIYLNKTWNLLKDDLSLQSEETLSFIASLL